MEGSNPASLTDPTGLRPGRADDPLAELPGTRSESQVLQEAKDEVAKQYGLGPNTPPDQVVIRHTFWWNTTYSDLVESVRWKKQTWYLDGGFRVEPDAWYAQELAKSKQPPSIQADTRTEGERRIAAMIADLKVNGGASPTGIQALEIVQRNDTMTGALFDVAREVAPDIAMAIASRGGGGARSAAARRASRATVPQGGVYLLRNVETDQVMRTGRTNDLVRREAEHARDPLLRDYRFESVFRTDNYAQQRGLEQDLDWRYNPPLNDYRGIDPRNGNLLKYLRAANDYLDLNQGTR